MALVVVDPDVLEDHVRRLISGDLELDGVTPAAAGLTYTQRSAREALLRYWLADPDEDPELTYRRGTRIFPGLGGAWIPRPKDRDRFMDRAPTESVRVGKPVTFRRSAAPVAIPVSGTPGWHLTALGTAIQGTGAGVRVGIADSGFDPAWGHEVTVAAYAAFDELSGDQLLHGQRDYAQTSKHGTQVASFACGTTEGVAPDAQAVVAAVLTGNDGKTGEVLQVAAGLEWLSTQNVQIVNCSWGAEAADPTWVAALSNLLTAGVTVVAAAGNHEVVEFPARFSKVVGVGAEAADGSIPSWSGVGSPSDQDGKLLAGSKPDLSMPGVDLYCGVTGVVTSGTSFSSPIAAGLLAVAVDGGIAVDQAVLNLQADLRAVLRVAEDQELGDGMAENTSIGGSQVDPTIKGFRLDDPQGTVIGSHERALTVDLWVFKQGEEWPASNMRAILVNNAGTMPSLSPRTVYVAEGQRFSNTPKDIDAAAVALLAGHDERYMVRVTGTGEIVAFVAVNKDDPANGVIEWGHGDAPVTGRLPVATSGQAGRVLPLANLTLIRKAQNFVPAFNGQYLEVI